ncbi:hypothetical protein B0H15DRAFT_1026964 [Mycena belliarum]|uniref:Uncharacterized protein n=1 Tax=Mycena belliarum TaxID=1033014 RepID=A0AAD6TPV9_9AGAR|nr:hypothetical protein B0H15DRAFT_1026964 [Mycena belliae]
MDSDGDVGAPHKRTLHSKRSFGKHPKIVDSPAYDASEEDNDPLSDDAHSTTGPPPRPPGPSRLLHPKTTAPRSMASHQLASSLLSDSMAAPSLLIFFPDLVVPRARRCDAPPPLTTALVFRGHFKCLP